MKKILLASSALIAVASFAFAGQAPKVSVSGSILADLEIGTHTSDNKSNDYSSPNKTGHDIGIPGGYQKIKFTADGKTDAGLNYGSYIELRPAASPVGTDQMYIKFSGDTWGSVAVGRTSGAADANNTNGQGKSGLAGFDEIASHVGDWTYGGTIVGGTNNTIRYTAPTISGISLAASYTPNIGGAAKTSAGDSITGNASSLNSVFETSLNYDVKMGDVSFGLNGNYATGKADDKRYNNGKKWHIGASVGFGPMELAGSYTPTNRIGILKQPTAGELKANSGSTELGIAYNVAGSKVGFTVIQGSKKYYQNSAQKNDSTIGYAIGASTDVADGMSAFIGYTYSSYNNGSIGVANGAEKETLSQVIVGTQINF